MASTNPTNPNFLTLPREIRQQILLDTYTPKLNADWNRGLWDAKYVPNPIQIHLWAETLTSALPMIKVDVEYATSVAVRRLQDEWVEVRIARKHLMPSFRRSAAPSEDVRWIWGNS
ncbi:hypothetical protein FKW77_004839 [Venturia effusa]|uniref:Uncharacterized protein n=1 Tax=Venturia effusa TaxID=50376 RepID=A0A517KW94_9PEZI|nr:hypothetical protein FKW77_004839 [Venturia effusa]